MIGCYKRSEELVRETHFKEIVTCRRTSMPVKRVETSSSASRALQLNPIIHVPNAMRKKENAKSPVAVALFLKAPVFTLPITRRAVREKTNLRPRRKARLPLPLRETQQQHQHRPAAGARRVAGVIRLRRPRQPNPTRPKRLHPNQRRRNKTISRPTKKRSLKRSVFHCSEWVSRRTTFLLRQAWRRLSRRAFQLSARARRLCLP